MSAERRKFGSAGFTLVELLVTIVIVGTLAGLATASLARSLDRARETACTGNMRSILAGVAAFTADREGRLWTRAEVGYSKFRMLDDPLGLPKLLEGYIVNKRVWLCPAGPKSLVMFGNNYTWNATTSFETDNAYAMKTLKSTLVIWDTYAYSLPSMYNGSEDYKGDGTSATGPSALPAKYQTKVHDKNTTVNWGFLDGHVINGATAAQ